jgi:hypothetical protein
MMRGRKEPTMPDSRIPPIPEELVQRLNARECVLFTGNGIAIEAGYPSWYEILEVLAKIIPSRTSKVSSARIMDLLRKGDIDLAAEIIQANAQPTVLLSFLERTYSVPPKLTTTHFLLESLPFAGTISANWDDTLERLFAPKARVAYWTEDPEAAATLLRDSEQFFVRLMGSPRRPESFVFSIDEYRKRLRTNETFLKFLTHLYSSYTFLFIGSRLSLIESFAEDLAFWSTPSQQHFALVEGSENLDIRAERLSTRFGIEVIPYVASDGYPEVEQFLTELRSRLDPAALSPASLQIEPATLDRVVLTNIGPFEPSGPTRGGASRPEVEDLLPLVLGGVDSRLDDAKQWVVNTYVRAESGEGSSPEEAARYARLLSTYFEILRLFPGLAGRPDPHQPGVRSADHHRREGSAIDGRIREPLRQDPEDSRRPGAARSARHYPAIPDSLSSRDSGQAGGPRPARRVHAPATPGLHAPSATRSLISRGRSPTPRPLSTTYG